MSERLREDREFLQRLAESRELQQKLGQEISRGLEKEEFQLYVQFYVDTKTYRIVGGETLSRWEHPAQGMLVPDQYIPLMEQVDLIDQLDYYTLDKLCGFLQKLYHGGVKAFFVSCNFSRGTFVSAEFVQRCREIIDRYDFPREMLVFELTETKEVKDTEGLKRNIRAVRDLGIRIALDDFGQGFTSFFDIQEYDLDVLKLDKSLTDSIGTRLGNSILRAMIQVGHELGMEVLAEGVETDEQVGYLQRMGCDVIQGFRFYYPIPVREVESRLRQIRSDEQKGAGTSGVK